MTIQYTGWSGCKENKLVFDARAHEHDDGKFQGFVHVILYRSGAQEEKDFPCGVLRETEDEALEDAQRLSTNLPLGTPEPH